MKFRNIIAGIIGVSFLFGTSAFAITVDAKEDELYLELSPEDKELLSMVQIEIPESTDDGENMINLFSTVDEIGSNIKLVKGEYPWELLTYGNEVKVAVPDSGYAMHDDLNDNVLVGYNLLTNTEDVTDTYGHGTHVSGIITAALNDIGVVGMAPKAKIIPLKITEAKSLSAETGLQSVLDAVNKFDCDVINMSWGASINNVTAQVKKLYEEALPEQFIKQYLEKNPSADREEAEKWLALPDKQETLKNEIEKKTTEYVEKFITTFETIMDYAYQKGAILVAAVGNQKMDDPNYPAACNNVIGVSAVTSDKILWSEENAGSNYGESVFVCAPGHSVYSTYINNGYETKSGTSQATPHVAGLAAIAKSINPNITQDEFKQLLIDTSEDLGDEGYDVKYGYGLVNAQALVEKMIENKVYISPINTDEGGCSALIYNNTDKKATGISIWAEYGDALSVFNTPVSVEIEKGEKKTVKYDKLPGAKLKHFLWSDMNTLEPLGISRAYGE